MASKTKTCIVLEFVTGGELFDKITTKETLKEDEARKSFQQLINAVDYCHSRGVFHRDLKVEVTTWQNNNLDVEGFETKITATVMVTGVAITTGGKGTISTETVVHILVDNILVVSILVKPETTTFVATTTIVTIKINLGTDQTVKCVFW